MKYNKDINIITECDVVVCGSGPAGICAAVSAAREGCNVVLREIRCNRRKSYCG